MTDLGIAFWNVKNLFEPNCGVERGPKSSEELEAKVSTVARVMSGLFGNRGPDLIGLAEIHTERILTLLIEHLPARYRALWEPCRTTVHAHTGLAVLARTDRFRSVDRVAAYSGPTVFGRPRYVIARCRLVRPDHAIFLVVNHWRSKLPVAESDDARDRMETAQALGEWLAGAPRDTCVVVLGDFNAEPYEEPFGELGLRSRRHHGRGLRLPHGCLYNTAWRFLAEPDPCETIVAGGVAYAASRPKTTFDAYDFDSVVFDQLMVSDRALRGGAITLQEGSVAYVCDDGAGYRRDGYMRPRRWTYHAGVPSGASDHFPLVATFRVHDDKMETSHG